MCNETFKEARERILMKNIAYAGALVALLDVDMEVVEQLLDEKFSAKKAMRESNTKALRLGYDFAKAHLQCPLPFHLEKMDANERQDSDRRQHRHRAGLRLRRSDGGRVVSHHALHVRDGRLQGVLREVSQGSRNRRQQFLHPASRGRTGAPSAWSSARPGTARARSRPPPAPAFR